MERVVVGNWVCEKSPVLGWVIGWKGAAWVPAKPHEVALIEEIASLRNHIMMHVVVTE